MIERATTADPALRKLLESHPKVASVEAGGERALRYWNDGRERQVFVGIASEPLRGLVELMDNNPLVCSERMSVPDAASTLALIALGPLASAGLILERPSMLASCEADADVMSSFLAPEGWDQGVSLLSNAMDMGGAVAITAICAIPTPERLEDIDELYRERFSRSLYVREEPADGDWHVNLVLGQPFALYRLRIAPDDPSSLLTIQVMADRDGKCGAAQVVHAMNIMCGFEESLGIDAA
jgi:hypothetical protein